MRIAFESALVTGASGGIGRAIAVKLAQEGVRRIAIHYRSRRDRAEETLAAVKAAGGDGMLLAGDTSDATRMTALVDEAAQGLGGCDIFVQCAVPPLPDIYAHTLATSVPLDKWQLGFDTQARAFFVGAPRAATFMRKGGRILALSYRTGAMTGSWQPWVGMGSAKAALESMCRYFAVALARDGVTVNAVSPLCSDDTTLFGQFPPEGRQAVKDWAASGWAPMRRLATAADVANTCALLCSEEASFITGQSIAVDGGTSLMSADFPLAVQLPA
ncbi:MAG TPA: SDR family oxidoreductase [Pseudolabrys sp.]|nr:SDR family oxidoreductase [Pseudolabrys sp.]